MLRKKTLVLPVTFAIFLLATPGLYAQNLSDTSAKPVFKVLDSIEVSAKLNTSYIKAVSATGTKIREPVIDIPQTLSSVTRQLNDDKMNFSLKESVIAAANVNAYSGYDEYSIRGFLAENPRMINGLRGYNSTYSSLLLLNIESVDILKGPAAVLYGNTDPGGTVNLTTKKPLVEPSGQIAVFGGSWDHFRATGDITGPANDSKTILYRLNAGYDQGHGFVDQFYSKAFQIAPSFAFNPNKNLQISLDFSLSDINTILDRGQPGLKDDNNLYATPVSLSVSQPGDYLKEKDLSSLISLTWNLSDQLSFHSAWLNYQTRQKLAEHGLDSYISSDSVNLYYRQWQFNTNTNSLTNYFNYGFHIGQTTHEAMIGYDYISTSGSVDEQRFENPAAPAGSGIVGVFNLLRPEYNQLPVSSYRIDTAAEPGAEPDSYYTQGIYLQDQINYKKFRLLLGIRREFYRTRPEEEDSSVTVENVWLPRVGLMYGVSPALHVYALYSRGFDPYEISNKVAVYNEPFKPINSELFEVGFKAMLLKGKLYGTVSVYQLSIYNVAVNANDPSNPDLYVQRGEDRARGIETEWNGSIFPNFQVHLAYAYNVTEIRQSAVKEEIGRIKENAPIHSGNGFFKYGFIKGSLKGISFMAGYTFAGERNTLDKNLELPGYFTMQGGVNFSWRQLNLSFLVNNIGNTEYWCGAYNNVYKWPGAGRNFMMKMNWDIPFKKSVKN